MPHDKHSDGDHRMNEKAFPQILMTVALLLAGAVSTRAQHENHGQQKPTAQAVQQGNKKMDMHHGSMNMSTMIDDGSDVLAMAYLQSVAAFARSLKDRVDPAKSVDVDFVRAVVAEMRRSFDTMQQHLTIYQRSMPADMQSQAGMQSHADMQSPSGTQSGAAMQSHGAMMQGADQHLLELRKALEFLEREVESNSPRANRISERAAEIIKHVEMMDMSSAGHKDHKI